MNAREGLIEREKHVGFCPLTIKVFLGILQRDQENSVVYGSIDAGKTVASNQEFVKLVSLFLSWHTTVKHHL